MVLEGCFWNLHPARYADKDMINGNKSRWSARARCHRNIRPSSLQLLGGFAPDPQRGVVALLLHAAGGTASAPFRPPPARSAGSASATTMHNARLTNAISFREPEPRRRQDNGCCRRGDRTFPPRTPPAPFHGLTD